MQVMVCVPAVVIGLVDTLETVVIAAGDEVPELLEPTAIDRDHTCYCEYTQMRPAGAR